MRLILCGILSAMAFGFSLFEVINAGQLFIIGMLILIWADGEKK